MRKSQDGRGRQHPPWEPESHRGFEERHSSEEDESTERSDLWNNNNKKMVGWSCLLQREAELEIQLQKQQVRRAGRVMRSLERSKVLPQTSMVHAAAGGHVCVCDHCYHW